MSYQVNIERQVLKQLRKIPEPDYTHLKEAISALAYDPRPTHWL